MSDQDPSPNFDREAFKKLAENLEKTVEWVADYVKGDNPAKWAILFEAIFLLVCDPVIFPESLKFENYAFYYVLIGILLALLAVLLQIRHNAKPLRPSFNPF
jgi:hypothetical protein